MTREYRSAQSYLSKDPEKQARSRANLLQGRMKQARKAKVKAPEFKDPAYKSDIIKFAEEQFFIPETKQPIILEDFQKKEILEPLFYAKKRPTMGLIGQTKKSGKSTLAAMISSWFLFKGEDDSEVYLAARDKDQASWIVFSKLVKAIQMNPQMLLRCEITKDKIELPHKGSILRCLPTDVSASGLNPNLVVFDELWSYEYESMTRFFEEMTTVPTRIDPLCLIVSYAGYDEDSLLYELYQKGIKGKDSTFFFYWSHDNKMPWQTKEYLKQQQGRLRPGTFKRLHKNEWTSGEEVFIPMESWDVCVDRKHRPTLPSKDIQLVLGVDVAITGDSCAVVGTERIGNKIRLVCHKKWQPTKKNPIDLEETVEAYISQLGGDYTVKEVLYDPFQFHRSATTLAKEGINMVEFPQTLDRLTAMSQNLFDLIKGNNLTLYRDKEMRSHAQVSTAKESSRGWRIVKKKASQKIDLIIALAMSALGSTRLDTYGGPDIFIIE